MSDPDARPRRHIRLKEWGLLTDTTREPSDEYLTKSDHTLRRTPYPIRTNVEGYLKTGNDLIGIGARKKVVLLGGSFVESLFAEETARFASQLEMHFEDEHKNLQVWNGGYSGSTALHVLNTLLNKVLKSRNYISQVLLFTSMSDSAPIQRPNSYWENEPLYTPVIDEYTAQSHAIADTTRDEDTYSIFQLMVRACQLFRIEPIVVLSPYRNVNEAQFTNDPPAANQFDSYEQYRNQTQVYDTINNAARKAAVDSGANVIEGLSAFPQLNSKYFYDILHMNHDGHTDFASWLNQTLSNLES